jgi:hypothetical protein
VTTGPHAGLFCSRVTGKVPGPKNAAGKLLANLLGRQPAEGEQVDVSTLIGKRYLIVVENGQGGGTRVASAGAASDATPATPQGEGF